jgi:hypothetical protein
MTRMTDSRGGLHVQVSAKRRDDSMRSRVEAELLNAPEPISAERIALRLDEPTISVARAIHALIAQQRAYSVGRKGRVSLYMWGRDPSSAVGKVKAKSGDQANIMQRPTYDGHELRRLPIAEGRYRAYELPSLVNGKPVQPRGIHAQCVGLPFKHDLTRGT